MTDDARTPVLVAGARTPMGRLLGSLKDFSGTDLGGIAIKGALEKAGVAGDQVQYVIMGQVLTAGQGPGGSVGEPGEPDDLEQFGSPGGRVWPRNTLAS